MLLLNNKRSALRPSEADIIYHDGQLGGNAGDNIHSGAGTGTEMREGGEKGPENFSRMLHLSWSKTVR